MKALLAGSGFRGILLEKLIKVADILLIIAAFERGNSAYTRNREFVPGKKQKYS